MERIELSTLTETVKAQNKNEILQLMWPGEQSEKLVISIKPTLSLTEVIEFVNDAAGLCFGGNDEYRPEIKDFAIKKLVLDKYTNLTLPGDPSECYRVIYESDIFDSVLREINSRQFGEMIQAINDKIDYKAQTEISAIRDRLNELFKTYDELQEKISALVSGINPDDINNIVSAVSNGSFDMDKLVEATKRYSKPADSKVVPIVKKGN